MLKKTYSNVQALRALAAILVVCYHATKMVHDRLAPSWNQFSAGGAGVDIFFAISGFVIVLTTSSKWDEPGSWKTFLWRRLVRVVPLYWLMTAFKLVILLKSPDVAQHSGLQPWHVIASFLFIPAWNIEHQAFPLLTAGWTLPFEMIFYLLFTAMLLLQKPPMKYVTLLLAAFACVGLLRTESWGAAATLIDPIVLEFMFGMWIGHVTLQGYRLPVSYAAGGAIAALAAIMLSNGLPETTCLLFRVLFWGLPGALLLLAAISLEEPMKKIFPASLEILGNASYAIYLTHGFVLPAVGLLFARLHWHGIMSIVVALPASVILSCVIGVIVHYNIEKRITLFFLNRSREMILSTN